MDCDTFQPCSVLLFNSFYCAPTNISGSSKSESTYVYEWLIGLQTLVRTSFYNVQAFQPVSPHRRQRTNEYERLIGLQTLVRTSFYNVQAFQPVSPHRSQLMVLLYGLYCFRT
ncbi:hypothetical protein T07_14994 [Trichinella nelsoni]|uniref:Uncharacterized protein n=1 Tax=Trichinella nelsoni TaxID=6336 RepID=A0A0V0RCT8_9BILA|nr:hypothetical protein T07_14994 [Trichinella nelsoni]